MIKKYRFIVFSNENLDINDSLFFNIDTTINKNETYKYAYFLISRKDVPDNKNIYMDNFSFIGRRLKKEGIIEIHNSCSNPTLKDQLKYIINSSEIVNNTLDKLGVKPAELARIFSTRPADINMWQNMIATPDSFKLEIMEYLLSIDNYSDNHFAKYCQETRLLLHLKVGAGH